LTTNNKNFRVKNGLEVTGEIGVGSTPSYGTAGQILSSQGAGNSAAWIDVSAGAAYTSIVKHDVRLAESITKGQAVYVSSSNGSNMVVSKASNASEATSSKTLGLLESSGSTNNQRNVVTEGLLGGIDVGAAAAGDPVWLGTSGNLIYGLTNKPIAPAHLVFIGIVTRSGNNGEIFVRIQNGFELNELHTVLIGTDYTANSIPGDNEFLAYNLATNLWINQTAEEAGVANLSGATFTGNVAGTNISLSGNVNAATVNATTLIGNTNASTITTGTIPSGILGNSTVYVGTTAVALNRTTASQTLTGVSIDGNAGTVTNGVYTTTTSLPNVTSVNGTTIPSAATLLDSTSTLDASKLNSNTVVTLNATNVAATNVNATTIITSGDIAVNGGDITTNQTTATLYNTTATTVHIGNAANVTLGNITHAGNVTVNNDLVVYGNITFNNGASELSSTTIQVDDTLISLSDSNPADTSDIGFYAGYKVSTVDYHTGLVRDASDKVWNLFSNVAQPTGTVNFANAVYDTLKLGNLTAVSNVNAATVNGNVNANTITVYSIYDVGTNNKIYDSVTDTFGSGTGATKFYGNGASLTSVTAATATSATQVNTIANTTAATFYPTFVDANNGTTAVENVYTGAGLSFNPSTNTLTTTNIAATTINATTVNVTGQLISTVATGTAPLSVTSTTMVPNLTAQVATQISTTANNSGGGVGYLTFVTANTSSTQTVYTDTGLKWTPATNALSAGYLTASSNVTAGENISAVNFVNNGAQLNIISTAYPMYLEAVDGITLSGNVTYKTHTAGTNNNLLASTAYVDSAGLQLRYSNAVAGSKTLSLSNPPGLVFAVLVGAGGGGGGGVTSVAGGGGGAGAIVSGWVPYVTGAYVAAGGAGGPGTAGSNGATTTYSTLMAYGGSGGGGNGSSPDILGVASSYGAGASGGAGASTTTQAGGATSTFVYSIGGAGGSGAGVSVTSSLTSAVNATSGGGGGGIFSSNAAAGSATAGAGGSGAVGGGGGAALITSTANDGAATAGNGGSSYAYSGGTGGAVATTTNAAKWASGGGGAGILGAGTNGIGSTITRQDGGNGGLGGGGGGGGAGVSNGGAGGAGALLIYW